MTRAIDEAILEALGLEASSTTAKPHGGSSFASSLKITGTINGEPVHYFAKTSASSDAEAMLRGEYESLKAINSTVPSFCPAPLAFGAMKSSPNTFFLVMELLDFSAAGPRSKQTFASKLAKLHTTPAPEHDGRPMFGFPVTTCCGSTVQDNTWESSWAAFYAERRLRPILNAAIALQGPDVKLKCAMERVIAEVVPHLLGDRLKGVVPVMVHGDLWSGNRSVGNIGGKGEIGDVIYDASGVYGHSEYELGMMRMFDGFGPKFWKEYVALVPKAEPAEEWDDRLKLYELYHQMNHYSMFGSVYRGGAIRIMKDLVAKYGSGTLVS